MNVAMLSFENSPQYVKLCACCKQLVHLLLVTVLVWPAASSATTLVQLIDAALSYHPSIRSFSYRVDAADADVDFAKWQFYPTLSLSSEGSRTQEDDPSYQGDEAFTTFRVEQPLWTGGRLNAGLEKARSGARLSRISARQNQQEISQRVIQSYSDWLAAHFKIIAMTRGLEVHQDLLAQVTRRLEEGLSNESDLKLASGRLASTRSELAASVAQAEVALSRLSQLVGYVVEPDEMFVSRAGPRPFSSDLGSLMSQALAVAPSVQLALGKIRSAEADIRGSRSGLMPEISLRYEHARGNYFRPNSDPQDRVFLNIRTSLQPGLSSLSSLSRARSMLSSAQADVDWQRQLIEESVLGDYALASSFDDRVAALEESLQSSEGIYESYGRLFLAGRKTWQDLMNSVRDSINTEKQLADARAASLLVTWRLGVTTEGLSILDDEEIQ